MNLLINDRVIKKDIEDSNYLRDYLMPIARDLLDVFLYDNLICTFGMYELIENENFLGKLCVQDDDVRTFISLFFSRIISVVDVSGIRMGQDSDVYLLNNEQFNGNHFSVAEIAYENNYPIISPHFNSKISLVEIQKNNKKKQRYQLCDKNHYFVYKGSNDEKYISIFLQYLGFDIHPKFKVDAWDNLASENKIKILEKIANDSNDLIAKRFNKLGRVGRSNRVVRITNLDIYEYKITINNGTYRVYFKAHDSSTMMCLFYQKKTQKISSQLMNLLSQY